MKKYYLLLSSIILMNYFLFGQNENSGPLKEIHAPKSKTINTKTNKGLTTIYSMNFESNESTTGWWQEDDNNDGVGWGYFGSNGYSNNGGCAGYTKSTYNSADDRFHSPYIELEAGKEYVVSFYYAAFASQSTEKLKFSYQAVASTPITIENIGSFSSGTYTQCSHTISIDYTDNYYFTWWCYSDANEGTVLIDKFEIKEIGISADFEANKTSGYAPLNVTFTDTSEGNPTGWSWDFDGDGVEDSQAQNPSHTYTETGSYTVKLTVTKGADSKTETKTNYIVVSEDVAVTANFSSGATTGSAPFSVNFYDQSTGDPTSWSWDFDGDGNTDSNDKNPTYVYNTPGEYTVTLSVSDASSNDSKTKSNYITVTPETVKADFVADKTSGATPLLVSFTDKSTGNPTNWEWDFNNDGVVDSYSQNPSHTYTEQGSYSVKLKVSGDGGSNEELKVGYIAVTSSGGCFSPISFNMGFNEGESIEGWTYIDANSDENFWGLDYYGVDDSRCLVYNYSETNAANDWIFSPCFDMIEGATYTISFKYAVAGSEFPEKLSFGCSSEISSSMPIVLDLGEITNETFQTATCEFTPTTSGEYHFGWHCTSEADMWAVYVDDFTIDGQLPELIADFSSDKTSGNAPLVISFSDLSEGSPTSWSWDFNNDGTEDSDKQNPSYTFTEAGVYKVSLTINRGEDNDVEVKENYITVNSVGINQVLDKDLWRVYPNPAKGFVIIESASEVKNNFYIEVYNTKSQKVFEHKFVEENQLKINTNNFEKGMYYIKVISGKAFSVKKIAVK